MRRGVMKLPAFTIHQLSKPTGLLGRMIIRLLNDINQDMNETTLKGLNIQPDDRVLEIGFGGGALLGHLIRGEAALVAGLEISDIAVKKALKQYEMEIVSGRLLVKKLQSDEIPFPRSVFSKVCCVNVVYFWKDPTAMCREVHRILTEGGCFVVCYEPAGPNEKKTPPKKIEGYLKTSGFSGICTHRFADRRGDKYFCTTGKKQQHR